MLTLQIAPADVLAFQNVYLASLRTNMANTLKKRDKAKERRVDKALAASRKRLEENGGKVKFGGASAYTSTKLTPAERGAGRRKRMREVKRARALRQARAHSKAASVPAPVQEHSAQSMSA